jgi:Flp pilus assembly protein TadD
MIRSLIAAALALTLGCVTTPEKKPDDAPATSAETPEVPEGRAPASDAAPGGEGPTGLGAEASAAAPPPTFAPGTQARFKEGVSAASLGDLAAAERAFREVLDRDPKAAYAWTNLGLIDERKGDPEKAEKDYRKALGIDVTQDVAWDNLARLSCRTRRCPQIERELKNLIAKHPAAIGPRNALVYAMTQQGNLEAAASEAKKVLKADERNVRAMQLLANIYFRESKIELARLVLENARTIDANDAATHNALGLVFLQLKQRPQALESFRQASLLKPDFAEARNNFGSMLNDAQDFEAAVKELEAAVASAPGFLLAHLNLGNAYRGLQQVDKALAEYKKVQGQRPELPEVYFNLGVTHLDQDVTGLDVTQRLKTAIGYFDQYKSKGGKDERVEQYVKDANKGLEKEERRKEREKKDQLRKVEQAKKDADDSKRRQTEEAQAKVEAEAKAKADAEAAAKKADADAKKRSELDAKASAEAEKRAKLEADKQAKLDAARKAKEDAAAKRQAELDAKRAAAEAKKAEAEAKRRDAQSAKTRRPASRLGDDEPAPAPAKPAPGKLQDDDK